jgi:hypothetical protein
MIRVGALIDTTHDASSIQKAKMRARSRAPAAARRDWCPWRSRAAPQGARTRGRRGLRTGRTPPPGGHDALARHIARMVPQTATAVLFKHVAKRQSTAAARSSPRTAGGRRALRRPPRGGAPRAGRARPPRCAWPQGSTRSGSGPPLSLPAQRGKALSAAANNPKARGLIGSWFVLICGHLRKACARSFNPSGMVTSCYLAGEQRE